MMSNLGQEPRREGGATGRDRDSYFLQLARYIVCSSGPRCHCQTPVSMGVEQLWLDDRRNHGGRIHWLACSYFLH
jgi:hypothetical protein